MQNMDSAYMPQEDFEEVLIGDQSTENMIASSQKRYNEAFINNGSEQISHRLHLSNKDGNESEFLSIRKQIIRELSGNQLGLNKSKDERSALDGSRPDVELFDQVSDIMNAAGQRKNFQQSPSREIVL